MPIGPTLEVQEDLQIILSGVGDEVQQIPNGDKGDITVTNSGNTWTVNKNAILNKTTAGAVGADYILISDTSDSGNVKKALASDLISGLADGDKGDIAVSAGATVWTIENMNESATVTTGTYVSKVNQATLIEARKASAGTITKGQVVYITGSSGTHLLVELARADVESTSAYTIGIAATDITNTSDGFVMQNGRLTGLSTLPTATFTDGDALYLSETTAGDYRVGIPTAPNHGVFLGFAVRTSNGGAGEIDVRIQNYQELDELSDVNISSVAANNFLVRNATNTRWENKTTSDVKTTLSLNNVDNTSDANKPVSTLTQTALDNLELKTKITNGGLINGFIRVTVASNNLTVAISTSPTSQVDPTASNPVYVWIGDTLRSITGALSIAANAGTNWFNSGSSELATKEVDYFVYCGYNATDGVVLGYARIPYARLYSDFNTTNTNEKYARISTITNAASGDNYINVGRFAATLSAGAGYTWSVPTFNANNLIQRPIYETRVLNYQPVYSAGGSMTYTSVSTFKAIYQIKDRTFYVNVLAQGTTGGSADSQIRATLPLNLPDSGNGRYAFAGGAIDTTQTVCNVSNSGANQMRWIKGNEVNWGLGNLRTIVGTGTVPLIEG
jgi:hypothetical protein